MVKPQQHKIMFRVDASDKIGTGHVMRCLTLADALKNNGASTLFISRHMPLYLQEILAIKGHEFRIINSNQDEPSIDNLAHSDWLGVSQSRDALDTIKLLTNQTFDWLVVDHYALDTRWESALRQSVKNILVIDDIADREHDCDVLLDQNFYVDMQSRYVGKVPKHCQLLLGPRYALLRPEFLTARKQAKVHSGVVKRILVFFGGVDADNYTGMALSAMQNLDLNGIAVDVVIGTQHPNRDEILSICKTNSFICHIQTQHMAELMLQADLSIGAGGVAMLERCCLGLPSIVISIANNQISGCEAASKLGAIFYLGNSDNINDSILSSALLLTSSLTRLFLSIGEKGSELVDGAGVARLCKKLSFKPIQLRLAHEADCADVFQWRNHEETRKYFFDTSLVAWENHCKWFSKKLRDENYVFLIGLVEDNPIGTLRYELKGNSATVSVYLLPDKHGYGYGAELLRRGSSWLLLHKPEIKNLKAEVLTENISSIQTFYNAGFSDFAMSFNKDLDK